MIFYFISVRITIQQYLFHRIYRSIGQGLKCEYLSNCYSPTNNFLNNQTKINSVYTKFVHKWCIRSTFWYLCKSKYKQELTVNLARHTGEPDFNIPLDCLVLEHSHPSHRTTTHLQSKIKTACAIIQTLYCSLHNFVLLWFFTIWFIIWVAAWPSGLHIGLVI